MSRAILTFDAGPSSLRFALFAAVDDEPALLVGGEVEGLGVRPRFKASTPRGTVYPERSWTAGDAPQSPGEAIPMVRDWVRERYPQAQVEAIGHRVVHGGEHYSAPLELDSGLIAELEQLVPLAPMRQPHNLNGIKAARESFPDALQVACFDTAFHRGHPWVNDVFAIPQHLYDEGVRRYGFHGLSYEYVVQKLSQIAPEHASGRLVVAHLGRGASMCAIRAGQSVGSSMGFSGLDGLPMATQCGQIDAGVLLYLVQEKGYSSEEIADLLYHNSGLKGLSGISDDMRELEASRSPEAAQAIDYFVFRIRRELGAMAAILGGIDALAFAGGIGENSGRIRELICTGFEWLGLEFDHHRNDVGEQVISSDRSQCRVFVIHTDDEAIIAQHSLRLLDGRRATAGNHHPVDGDGAA